MLRVAQPKSGEERGDVSLGDLAQLAALVLRQEVEVAPQIAAIAAERVLGQSTFDGEMVQIRADEPRNIALALQPRRHNLRLGPHRAS